MTTPDQTARDVIAQFIPHLPNEMGRKAIDALADAGYAVVPAAEVEMLRRGGKELGRMVKRLSDDQLAAIGEKPGGDLIDTDGDGHWDEVWERLMSLRPERDAARAEVERLRAQIAAVQALHAEESTHAGGHPGGWCRGCHADWPCPTIQALDGEVTT